MLKRMLTTIGGLFESKAQRQAREEREQQEYEARIAQLEAEEKARREEQERLDPHDFGFTEFLMVTGYGDSKPREDITQRFILVNPNDCAKVKTRALMWAWCQSGHAEWEAYWAETFLRICDQAIKDGTEADISLIFKQDYYAGPNRCFTAEQTRQHILRRFFDVVSDTPEELKLRIQVSNA